MYSTTSLLISKLKKKPKHGTWITDLSNALNNKNAAGFEKGIKDLAQGAKELTQKLPSLQKMLTNMGDALTRNVSSFEAYSAGVGRALSYQREYNKSTLQLIKGITFLQEANAELNKTFGQSTAGAFVFSKTLREVGVNIGRGDASMFKYAKNLKDISGGFIASTDANKKFQKELLKGQAYLQDNMKLTDEQSQSFELYAAGIGKTGFEAAAELKGLTDALSDSTGIDATQLQKQILEDISDIGADLQLQYSKIPGSLEVASLKARVLGTSLANLNKTGQDLLNIESSIGAELEYQTLTGKRLLTDQGKSLTNEYRMATIRGDANKQADLMSQFIKDQGDELENNLFARKKAAELMGTDEATLARMIQKEKLAAKLGADKILELNQGDLEATAKELREKGAKEEDIKQLLDLSDTRTDVQKQTDYLASIESKIALSAQQTMVAAAGGDAVLAGKSFQTAMKKASEEASVFAKKMSDTFSDKDIIKSLGTVGIYQDRLNVVIQPIKQLGEALPIVGTTVTNFTNKLLNVSKRIKDTADVTQVTDKDDVIVTPSGGRSGYGSRVLLTPAGNFALNNNDTIIAGTRLNRADDVLSLPEGALSLKSNNNNLTATAIAQALISALKQSPIAVTNHVKVGDELYKSSKMNGAPSF